ncbi:MAG: hypothetical protein R3D44_13315 [Hyphomicrobiaceae bacterium]
MKLLRSAAALAAIVACMAPSTTPRSEEGWEATLKLQLDAEKKCLFERIVSVRQLPVEKLGALEGRVKCKDGREFDFSRQKAHQKFELHLCMPAVC